MHNMLPRCHAIRPTLLVLFNSVQFEEGGGRKQQLPSTFPFLFFIVQKQQQKSTGDVKDGVGM